MNPFVFGKPVGDEHFCDRKEELERICGSMRSANSLFLYSPRKYGKTSLILKAFEVMGEEVDACLIDLYSVTDLQSFAETYIREVSPLLRALTGGLKQALMKLREAVRALTVQASVDDEGRPVFSLGARVPTGSGAVVLEELLAVVEGLAAHRGRRVVIAFDEFQEVASVKGLERTLRTVLQKQRLTTYLFSGSKRSLLTDMFSDPNRPFFQFSEHMILAPIPREALYMYVAQRFKDSEVACPAPLIEDIIKAAEGHPHFTQYFAATLWELLRSPASTPQPLDVAWRLRVISGLDPVFRMVFDRLTPHQRRLILHLAAHGSDNLFSETVRGAAGLASSSTLSSTLKSLISQEIITKTGNGSYTLLNPAFKLWLDAISG